jgi:hypothetical protein
MSRLNVGKLIASVGIRLPGFTDSTRPGGEQGLMIYNSQSGIVEIFDGSEWNNVSTGSFTLNAVGGSEYESNGYKYHVFVGPGTFSVTEAKAGATIDVLVVAGGGGAGNYYYCGGSGAGGVVNVQNYPVQAIGNSAPVTVGAGGAYPYGDGIDSSFAGVLTAKGGGSGGGYPYGYSGKPGGSGGGGSLYVSGSGTASQSSISQSTGSGQLVNNAGNPGGPGPGWPGTPTGGGGGGGAGASGQPWGPGKCGDGGVGLQINGFSAADHPQLATAGKYGGGGGGGTYSPNDPSRKGYGGINPGGSAGDPQGQRYGGGNGGTSGPSGNGYASEAGMERTGGGAGGPDYPHSIGGGSGVVAIRYLTN